MSWQDLVFGAGSVVFVIALLPSVFSENKPDIRTSITTAMILLVFSVTYLSLSLELSAIVTFFTSVTWMVLAWQKAQSKH